MNAVQCDYCGKFAPNPVERLRRITGYARKLPGDWFAIATWPGGADHGDGFERLGEDGEFCSRECISNFFAAPPKAPA